MQLGPKLPPLIEEGGKLVERQFSWVSRQLQIPRLIHPDHGKEVGVFEPSPVNICPVGLCARPAVILVLSTVASVHFARARHVNRCKGPAHDHQWVVAEQPNALLSAVVVLVHSHHQHLTEQLPHWCGFIRFRSNLLYNIIEGDRAHLGLHHILQDVSNQLFGGLNQLGIIVGPPRLQDLLDACHDARMIAQQLQFAANKACPKRCHLQAPDKAPHLFGRVVLIAYLDSRKMLVARQLFALLVDLPTVALVASVQHDPVHQVNQVLQGLQHCLLKGYPQAVCGGSSRPETFRLRPVVGVQLRVVGHQADTVDGHVNDVGTRLLHNLRTRLFAIGQDNSVVHVEAVRCKGQLDRVDARRVLQAQHHVEVFGAAVLKLAPYDPVQRTEARHQHMLEQQVELLIEKLAGNVGLAGHSLHAHLVLLGLRDVVLRVGVGRYLRSMGHHNLVDVPLLRV